jgi:hypothetical protein
LAAQAGAEACLFRCFRQLEETDALAMCATRRARRATVNSCRADGEDKLTVEACIFRHYRLPQLIVFNGCVHVHAQRLEKNESSIYLVLAVKLAADDTDFLMCLNARTGGF